MKGNLIVSFIVALFTLALLLWGCEKFESPTKFNQSYKSKILIPSDFVINASLRLAIENPNLQPAFIIKFEPTLNESYKASFYSAVIEKNEIKPSRTNIPKLFEIIDKEGNVISKSEINAVESLPPDDGVGSGGGYSGGDASIPNADIVYAEFLEDAYYLMRFGGLPLKIYINPSTLYPGQSFMHSVIYPS